MSANQTDHATPTTPTNPAKLMPRIKRNIRSHCDEAALFLIKKNTHTLSKRNYRSIILYMRRISTYPVRTIEYVWSKYSYICNTDADACILQLPNKNSIFLGACIESNIPLVKLLLEDRAVNPNLCNGRVIDVACSNKDPDLLKILLDDGRCDPTYANNCALTFALRDLEPSRYNVKRVSDYIKTLRLMLQDKRVDVRNDTSLLADACTSGIIELVHIILEHNTNPGAYASMAVRHAAKTKDNHEIISLLLQDERVDPSEYRNEALENAVMYGGISNVRALLSDERVVSNSLGRSMDYARACKMSEMYELLYSAYLMREAKKINT